MFNQEGKFDKNELKDSLQGCLIAIVIFILGVVIYNLTYDLGDNEGDNYTHINVDKQEGLTLLGEISTLDFNEMTEKYGKPSRFYDLTSTSGRYWCEWDKILIKKEGVPIWCNLKTAYTSRTNVYSTWDTYNCK